MYNAHKSIMKQIFTVILIIICYSCTKKIVQLPETTNQDITEIMDVSPVYMFYDEETDSIEFNRNNMISTTNWLVNIDKRLTLKQILPHLQYLQEKRHGDGMHKNESARNYFTCNNTVLKNLSFIDFTDIMFESDSESLNSNDTIPEDHFGILRFISSELVEIKSVYEEDILIEESSFDHLLDEINELMKSEKITLTLAFKSSLIFQDYISIKSKILAIKSENLEILNQEIIYN